jgi:hypothetical protein
MQGEGEQHHVPRRRPGHRDSSGYVRREPGNTVLHQLVREHLETFLAQASQDGRGLPPHVENELRRCLACGQLSEGFVRVV